MVSVHQGVGGTQGQSVTARLLLDKQLKASAGTSLTPAAAAPGLHSAPAAAAAGRPRLLLQPPPRSAVAVAAAAAEPAAVQQGLLQELCPAKG